MAATLSLSFSDNANGFVLFSVIFLTEVITVSYIFIYKDPRSLVSCFPAAEI